MLPPPVGKVGDRGQLVLQVCFHFSLLINVPCKSTNEMSYAPAEETTESVAIATIEITLPEKCTPALTASSASAK